MGEMICLEFALNSKENENTLFFRRDVLESKYDMCLRALVDTCYALGFLMQNVPC